MATKSKAKTGSVVVFERNQLLSLRWSWRGKRYQFSPKLRADVIGKAAAEMKARQIEIDMATGQFDPTLAKYKGELVQGARVNNNFISRLSVDPDGALILVLVRVASVISISFHRFRI